MGSIYTWKLKYILKILEKNFRDLYGRVCLKYFSWNMFNGNYDAIIVQSSYTEILKTNHLILPTTSGLLKTTGLAKLSCFSKHLTECISKLSFKALYRSVNCMK